ncbi:MAG: CBS domain-containing protein [Flammeovirgaceae bacterium]
MGAKAVKKLDENMRQQFIKHLLDDVKTLERMLEQNLFESGTQRIGAEQEFCLIDETLYPSFKAIEILDAIQDDHFTTELAKYNLEINLDPQELGPKCLQHMRQQLEELLAKAQEKAEEHKSNILLTGILPTIRKSELDFEYMTPNPRYHILDEIIRQLRGGDFYLHIQGIDELATLHESVLFEACNTSFQMHYQVHPKDFVDAYNWAMAISGPILALCTNSPILLGRELWQETRIAVFQQSIDTRSSSYSLKNQEPRVTFGNAWLKDSVVELFKDDISRFTILLANEVQEHSSTQLEQGVIPELKALRLHNGTVYRWNRPCYGVNDGVAHLRIENRYIPSGPTVIDEMANMALWLGLMHGMPEEYKNIASLMDFKEVKNNFLKAARLGKGAQMFWMGELIPAKDFMLLFLLPIASEGLKKVGIPAEEIDYYLGIIRKRAEGNTGAEWMIKNYRNLQKEAKQAEALSALTLMTFVNQNNGHPIHEWENISTEMTNAMTTRYTRVEQIMSTDLFTVYEGDSVELVIELMKWHNIHHMPVENKKGELVGIISSKDLENHLQSSLSAKEVMIASPTVTYPEANVENAVLLMLAQEIGCLPVAQKGKLVGIITKNDVLAYQEKVS